MPKGRYPPQREIPQILEDTNNGLPMLARQMISNLWERIKLANEQILFYDQELIRQAHHHAVAKRLLTIPGVGEQVASSVIARVPDSILFKNSLQFAAWLGLVPRQYTTGGNVRLGRLPNRAITTCARSVLANLKDKQEKISKLLND